MSVLSPRRNSIGVGVLWTVVLVACATPPRCVVERGQPFDYEALSKLSVGQSTPEDVLRVLGPPFRVGMNAESRCPVYIYAYLGLDVGRQAIIEFGKEGYVSDIKGNSDVVGRVTVISQSGGVGTVNAGDAIYVYAFQYSGSEVVLTDMTSLTKYTQTLEAQRATPPPPDGGTSQRSTAK